MIEDAATEANRLKQLAGIELKTFLTDKFSSLMKDNIISDFKVDQNFNHKGFTYNKQYLANFIIETLDNKFIVINSSNSYRHDRMKLQSYDLEGVTNNAFISDKIIASILLFPDKELDNQPLISFRNKVDSKDAYSPASHILVISELVLFLKNHRDFVEEEKSREEIEEQQPDEVIKDGSYYGLRGNAFEKEVIAELNNLDFLQQLSSLGESDSQIVNAIIHKICNDNSISVNELVSISATNTVLKLKSGGNAKTDIVVTLQTFTMKIIETISVKNTTQNRVSCHDYKSDDFIRVLNVRDSGLADYLNIYQLSGSHDSFIRNLPSSSSLENFIELLNPYSRVLLEWALTGKHDHQNLIDPDKQVSNYLLINKSGNIKFIDFPSYICELYDSNVKLVYGLPLSWTYPSKQRGARIQLKVPILL